MNLGLRYSSVRKITLTSKDYREIKASSFIIKLKFKSNLW